MRHWDGSNKLMMKFGNGIDGALFELLDVDNNCFGFGDSISDTNAMTSGGYSNQRGETKLHFSTIQFIQ